jgi:hypothetical protein
MDGGAGEKLLASLRRPERGAKIGAAERAKKRPAEAVEKMRQAKTGHRYDGETRERMRQAQLERYAREGRWTPALDAMLGTVSDSELARRWGLRPGSVRKRRIKLDVPPFTRPAS